jgi:very-short-patch-repair endonuclease
MSDVPASDSDAEATYLVEVLGVRHPIPVSGSRDERISAVANRQRGRISRDQMRAAGIKRSAIDRRARSGHLIRKQKSVYAVGHTAPAPLAAETEALLACGPHAVLSHHTAARLHKLVDDRDTSIHVTIRARHGANPTGVHVHRTTRLNRSEVRIVEGLPVTSALRTLIDLAGAVDLNTLERAIEQALHAKLVSVRQLRQATTRCNGRRGISNLKAILDLQREPGFTRSEAERLMRKLIRLAQLPEPRTNVPMHGVEADFYWPDLGVVIEVQSQKYHLTRGALERDTRKAARLTAAGLTVSYVTRLQMKHEPFAVVARVAQTLARAEATRLRSTPIPSISSSTTSPT